MASPANALPVSAGPRPFLLGSLPVTPASAAQIEGAILGALLASFTGAYPAGMSYAGVALWTGAALGYTVMGNAMAPPVSLPGGLTLQHQAQIEGVLLGMGAGYTMPQLVAQPMVVGAAAGALVRTFV